jgi:hypothetical protein
LRDGEETPQTRTAGPNLNHAAEAGNRPRRPRREQSARRTAIAARPSRRAETDRCRLRSQDLQSACRARRKRPARCWRSATARKPRAARNRARSGSRRSPRPACRRPDAPSKKAPNEKRDQQKLQPRSR